VGRGAAWGRGVAPGIRSSAPGRRAFALKPGSDCGRTIGLKPRMNCFIALDFKRDNLLCTF